jgi:hypothetical protein
MSADNTEKEEKKYLINFLGGGDRKKKETHTHV